eukprot:9492211-Pyramimonas_sp.AAC.2
MRASVSPVAFFPKPCPPDEEQYQRAERRSITPGTMLTAAADTAFVIGVSSSFNLVGRVVVTGVRFEGTCHTQRGAQTKGYIVVLVTTSKKLYNTLLSLDISLTYGDPLDRLFDWKSDVR